MYCTIRQSPDQLNKSCPDIFLRIKGSNVEQCKRMTSGKLIGPRRHGLPEQVQTEWTMKACLHQSTSKKARAEHKHQINVNDFFLQTIVEEVRADHGAPLVLHKEVVLYPDESEDVVAIETFDQNQIDADRERPASRPPTHHRRAVMAKTRNIMA